MKTYGPFFSRSPGTGGAPRRPGTWRKRPPPPPRVRDRRLRLPFPAFRRGRRRTPRAPSPCRSREARGPAATPPEVPPPRTSGSRAWPRNAARKRRARRRPRFRRRGCGATARGTRTRSRYRRGRRGRSRAGLLLPSTTVGIVAGGEDAARADRRARPAPVAEAGPTIAFTVRSAAVRIGAFPKTAAMPRAVSRGSRGCDLPVVEQMESRRGTHRRQSGIGNPPGPQHGAHRAVAVAGPDAFEGLLGHRTGLGVLDLGVAA